MEDLPEVTINLWCITDQSGLLISLKGRAYVMTGSDEEKLEDLNNRALFDFMIAEDFELPKWLITTVGTQKYNTATYQDVKLMGNEDALFEECMIELESRFSKTHSMKISKQPLVCITPLWMDDDNNIKLFDNMRSENF